MPEEKITQARTVLLPPFVKGGSAFVLQFITAPLLLSFMSLRFIHPAIPVVHIAAAVALTFRPSLFTGGLAYLLFKALDYSVFRAGKEIFYIPLSFGGQRL